MVECLPSDPMQPIKMEESLSVHCDDFSVTTDGVVVGSRWQQRCIQSYLRKERACSEQVFSDFNYWNIGYSDANCCF